MEPTPIDVGWGGLTPPQLTAIPTSIRVPSLQIIGTHRESGKWTWCQVMEFQYELHEYFIFIDFRSDLSHHPVILLVDIMNLCIHASTHFFSFASIFYCHKLKSENSHLCVWAYLFFWWTFPIYSLLCLDKEVDKEVSRWEIPSHCVIHDPSFFSALIMKPLDICIMSPDHLSQLLHLHREWTNNSMPCHLKI